MYCSPWHQMQESNQLQTANFNPKLGDFKAPKQLPPLRQPDVTRAPPSKETEFAMLSSI